MRFDRLDPVEQRAFPHERRRTDERDVACEQDALIRHPRDDVAERVARTEVLEPDARAAGVQPQAVLERDGRRDDFDAAEVERRERALEIAARRRRCRRERRDTSRATAGLAPVNISARQRWCPMTVAPVDELVAAAVVAVVVRVDDLADRLVGHAPDCVEELLGVLQIEERVHEDRFVVADDDPGVATTPSCRPVGGTPSSVPDLHQAPLVGHAGTLPRATTGDTRSVVPSIPGGRTSDDLFDRCSRPETGELGVAVQSHWFSTGSVVTWGVAGVGVVATQAFANPSYGPLGLDLMREGVPAPEALASLLERDDGSPRRQVAMVDANGAVGVHTGDRCIAGAGHVTGDGYSVQANMMLTDTVPDAMSAAFSDVHRELVSACSARWTPLKPPAVTSADGSRPPSSSWGPSVRRAPRARIASSSCASKIIPSRSPNCTASSA